LKISYAQVKPWYFLRIVIGSVFRSAIWT